MSTTTRPTSDVAQDEPRLERHAPAVPAEARPVLAGEAVLTLARGSAGTVYREA